MAAASLTLYDSTSDRFLQEFITFFVLVSADSCVYNRIDLHRFFAVFDGFCECALSAHHFLVAAVGATGSAPSPNLGGEFLPFFLWGFVNDPPAGVMCASGVL
jgi:hypothetical protein